MDELGSVSITIISQVSQQDGRCSKSLKGLGFELIESNGDFHFSNVNQAFT